MPDQTPNLVQPNRAQQMWAAPLRAVEVRWKLANPGRLVIGPRPRLVLAARARRDVELLHLRVDYPKMGDADARGQHAEAVLVQVPRVAGLRRLRPEGEPWVQGQEDVLASAMFDSRRPEERASDPDHIRWSGALQPVLDYNRNDAPCVWWAWRGRVLIPRGLSVGLIVRASAPTVCRALLAGI